MEDQKSKPIFIPWPNEESIKRRRSLSFPTPPDVKWSDKIKSILRPRKPSLN